MANVQKRPLANGETRYVVKYRTPDGKARSKGGFLTKKEADAYATNIDFSHRRGQTFDPKAGEIPFRLAAEQWLESRHDLKPRTFAGYKGHIRPGGEIDTTFGGYPLKKITRTQISEWVAALTAAGKQPSTVRHEYFVVRMVLAQAVVDGRLADNPADYVRLPSERSANGGTPGVVDDPDMFLTAEQVQALVEATPWPFNVMVNVAAWAGLRAAELGGLQVGDVDLPARALNPNAPAKPGQLRVDRTVMVIDGVVGYDTPKTRGSRRKVPLTPATVELMRVYLAQHPQGLQGDDPDPTAPLFPAFRLIPQKPTGKKATDATGKRIVPKAEDALAALSVDQAEQRLALDWTTPVRHNTFYKSVYRPAVLRANRLGVEARTGVQLPPLLKFHALRHTYASLCVAAGIPPLAIARFMGHAKVTTTLSVYTHLFEDDHADAMASLGAMSTPRQADDVMQLGA